MLVYATPEDLTGAPWNVAADNAHRLLRAASALVRTATRSARYATTADGLPTAPDVVEAFRDATCAQAAAWHAAGIDPTTPASASSRVAQSKSIGSASITYADAAQVAAARHGERDALAPEVALILDAAGLLAWRPVVYG